MKFSVVTPSFQSSKWLRLCIASVADQDVLVEHIVQDAGSGDGTIDWLLSDARVSAFVEPDRGMYDAINRGMKKATGDIIAYLNCDEQYLPGALLAVEAFFQENPSIDILFSNAVVVDSSGGYLFHRKVGIPRKFHTWVCHLGTLSCGMFFRRKIIDRGVLFNPDYRMIGDMEWVLRLINDGFRMATLPHFTSVFTNTGSNLSLRPEVEQEKRMLLQGVPAWIKLLKPMWILHHRLNKFLQGGYSQAPFSYSVYTLGSPLVRVEHSVKRPSALWRWR